MSGFLDMLVMKDPLGGLVPELRDNHSDIAVHSDEWEGLIFIQMSEPRLNILELIQGIRNIFTFSKKNSS